MSVSDVEITPRSLKVMACSVFDSISQICGILSILPWPNNSLKERNDFDNMYLEVNIEISSLSSNHTISLSERLPSSCDESNSEQQSNTFSIFDMILSNKSFNIQRLKESLKTLKPSALLQCEINASL